MRWAGACALVILLLPKARGVAAQNDLPRFEAGGYLVFMQQRAFASYDVGFGGRFTFYPLPYLGVEAEAGLFPRDTLFGRQGRNLNFSGGRTLALFGAKVGKRRRNVGVFGKVRPGLIHFSPASRGVACVAILVYPPPLECRLSQGSTNSALDFGGVLEWYPARRIGIRLDVGDLVIRFPPAFTRLGQFKEDFSVHNLQVYAGIGFRF
jgi:hypothetical protein